MVREPTTHCQDLKTQTKIVSQDTQSLLLIIIIIILIQVKEDCQPRSKMECNEKCVEKCEDEAKRVCMTMPVEECKEVMVIMTMRM